MIRSLCLCLCAILAVPVLGAGCGGGRPEPVEKRKESGSRKLEIRAGVVEALESTRQAVIGAGRDQGVVVGTVFDVYRGKDSIGRVQVTVVWKATCGGRVVESRGPIKAGDGAVAHVLAESTAAGDPTRPVVRKPKARPGTIHASLAAVKPKEKRAVISAGSDRGVKSGKVFYVYSGDEYVGRVRVTLVREKMSGAEILESRIPFKPGLRAVYDPEDEQRDAGWIRKSPTDSQAAIKELEAKIADPETSEADRKAAREVLLRLKRKGGSK